MALEKPIHEYATVRTWVQDYERHWGADGALERRLRTLERFCEFAERDPDTIVQECLRAVDGGMRIRPKGRRFYMAKIREFENRDGGRPAGNLVRSFLIHNGVALSADVMF